MDYLKKLSRILLISILMIFDFKGFAQKVTLGENAYIISFATIYKSNLMDMNIGSNGLYLLKTTKQFKTDYLFCSYSKKNYSRLKDIIDTFKKDFEVYQIASGGPLADKNETEILKGIENYNNYGTGYFYDLNDTAKKYDVVKSFVLQKYSKRKKIWYKKVKSMDPSEKYDVIIYRME